MSFEIEPDISAEIKTMILNMFEMFKKERDDNQLHVPLDSAIERIHIYTGLAKSRILNLCQLKSLVFPSVVVDELPLNLLTSITAAFLQLYLSQKVPKCQDVYNILKTTCINAPSTLDGFQNTLTTLGYEYKKIKKDSEYLLVENPALTFERTLYLRKMKKIRTKKTRIYYIDERIITPLCNFKKPWACTTAPKSNTFITDGIILFHVISQFGVSNCLFSNNISHADFSKWLSDIVIPSLEPKSVIVMENNQFHGTMLTNPITRYHSKADMIGILKQNNIPCTANMSKAELYSLIEKTACLKSHCAIDQMLRAHGHELVLLPTNYQKLSAAENLWCYIKQKVFCHDLKKNQDLSKKSLMEIKNIVQSIIDGIPLFQWHTMVNKNVAILEDQIYLLDSKVETALDQNFIFVNDPEEILTNKPLSF